MNFGDAIALLLGLGVGGVVGAALAVLAAGNRLAASWSSFSFVFRNFVATKTGEEIEILSASFEELRGSLDSLMASVNKLRRVLKLK